MAAHHWFSGRSTPSTDVFGIKGHVSSCIQALEAQGGVEPSPPVRLPQALSDGRGFVIPVIPGIRASPRRLLLPLTTAESNPYRRGTAQILVSSAVSCQDVIDFSSSWILLVPLRSPELAISPNGAFEMFWNIRLDQEAPSFRRTCPLTQDIEHTGVNTREGQPVSGVERKTSKQKPHHTHIMLIHAASLVLVRPAACLFYAPDVICHFMRWCGALLGKIWSSSSSSSTLPPPPSCCCSSAAT